MMGNYHVPCGAGEKLEITSKVYLLQPRADDHLCDLFPSFAHV
jgi:hypothetical protein